MRFNRRAVVSAMLVAGATAGSAGVLHSSRGSTRGYEFSYEGVLGTSLDMIFVAELAGDAAAAERAVLAEIERLNRILSRYDSTSEVSRLAAAGRVAASPELASVLDQYASWQARTGNAFSARTGELAVVWARAAQEQRAPDARTLDSVVAAIARPGWQLDPANGETVALTDVVLDLGSLGKGYILDHAARAARAAAPSLEGGMINLGGDIRAWGAATESTTWEIPVADPRRPADNAPPLTRLVLTDRAVSSSGNYARGFTLEGRHRSHILDPRTGYPADRVLGATVVASDNATANVLATSLSVLSPDEGLRLIAATPGAAGVIVTAVGEVVRSPGFAALEARSAADAPRTAAARPAEPRIKATVELDLATRRSYTRRPYVAVWVMDSAKKHVRTLAVWGNKQRYLADFDPWWDAMKGNQKLMMSLARATRSQGKYTVEWDGTNQAGKAAPPGTYSFWLEALYEGGDHSTRSVTVACVDTPASGAIEAAPAFGGAVVQCSVTP